MQNYIVDVELMLNITARSVRNYNNLVEFHETKNLKYQTMKIAICCKFNLKNAEIANNKLTGSTNYK